ncbi:Aste57867_5061 [Aphanomyces stellatus]|uniref:Aste57867_5061 protein n=1 Tax=Aphanomyces stellatus TaxID=120398 RepID=A0A485KH77_9STRA|nr:hypothetical protein As57867_005048 [Aphanomyces stellatus]VFT82142.1 Aste57867_5061 [Aphanomyces stellatus]
MRGAACEKKNLRMKPASFPIAPAKSTRREISPEDVKNTENFIDCTEILTDMDESDNLISVTLKQSGWSGDVPPVATIAAPELVELVSWGFAQIQEDEGGVKEPFKFDYPKGVAQRHRVAAALAEQFKAMGYTGDCGYNHLLYPTEGDTRRMLLWLIQKLPKIEKEANDVDTPRLQFRQRIHASLLQWTAAAAPATCVQRRARTSMLPATWLETSPPTTARRGYIASQQPFTTNDKLCPAEKTRSLLELNALALTSDTSQHVLLHASEVCSSRARFITRDRWTQFDDRVSVDATLRAAFDAAKLDAASTAMPLAVLSTSPESRPASFAPMTRVAPPEGAMPSTDDGATSTARAAADAAADKHMRDLVAMESELAALRETCVANEFKLREYDAATEDQETLNRQIEARLATKTDDLRDVEQEVGIRQQTLDMLSDASNNIAKLQAMCATSAQRLVQLAEEWEGHRVPLIQQLESHAATQLHRQAHAKELVQEMQVFRADMKDMGDVYAQKQEQRQLLERKYASMTKGINRSMYTLRIMDIIKQVHKQKADIQKIVKDIRLVQKQINISSEKLKRSEAVAEERLFHAAKDDKHRPEKKQMYVECYRLFTTIRELFDELIACVAECGKRENQSRDLEIWIAQMAHRVNMSNLDQINHDMQQVKRENQALMQEIQARTLETP